MIYLNDHIDAFDIHQALETVGPQRRQKALQYRQERDQKLSLAVYLLLQEGLRKEYGIQDVPDFIFGKFGKPLLKGYPHIHFNLSHCREAALCVVSESPVGCDIESVPSELDMELCRHCFNEDEITYIEGSDQPTIAFAELWTKKEAFLKLTGEGLVKDIPNVLCDTRVKKVSFETHVSWDKSYVYTVCR